MNAPKKILTGFFYTLGSGYAVRLLSFVLTLLIKNALGLEILDRMVPVLLVFILLSNLHHFGMVQALLHFQDDSAAFIRTHFALNALIEFSGFLLTCGAALALAYWYPAKFAWMVWLVCLFAVFRLLRNMAMTSEGLLRRDFEYGRLSLFHGLGTVLALSFALAAAWSGWGHWSLVLGGWSANSVYAPVYVLFFTGAVWCSRRISLRPLRLDWGWVRRIMRFGVWFWLGWVLQTFVWHYDKLILFLMYHEGIENRVLNLYDHAWWLVQVPTGLITHILFSYTNALYSRYQKDRQRLGEFFAKMLGLVVRVSAPLAMICLFNAHAIVVLTAPQWVEAAPILVWLGLYAFLRPLADEGLSLLWALGKTRQSTRIMGVQAGVALILVPLAARAWGVQGVAYSMGVIGALGVCGLALTIGRLVKVPWRRVFVAPICALGAMGGVGAFYEYWAMDVVWADFILRSGLMGIVYAGALLLLEFQAIKASVTQVKRILAEPKK
ncbi:MAG: oligosaccharide flippase family protein [Candidatus Latescibacteria bacterium]|nr:oligosaccharide flippase family protein [Candidatus Latescibacterota bacterium]